MLSVPPIVDTGRLQTDEPYRQDMAHRFLTDHFFAAHLVGFHDFSERAHGPAVSLYFPKNPNLPMSEQDSIHKRIHLDPRHTFKTTLKRVDRLQWLGAFPGDVTILVESATQPLAEASSIATSRVFWRDPRRGTTVLQILFPQLTFTKMPDGVWNSPCRRPSGPGDLDTTLAYTSPKSTQSGWHPFILEPDDVEDTNNSGIHAEKSVRQSVIDTCDQNENLLRAGGYINITGTRYHPFDYYGKLLERAAKNPEDWKVLVRCSVKRKDGSRFLPGEFPPEDEVELQFPEYMNLSYRNLRDIFYNNYESFMCFRQGSKVLMADWSEKPIEEIVAGEKVIGFEKTGPYRTRLVETEVKRTFSRKAQVIEMTTSDGRRTFPTADHKYLRTPNGGDLKYRAPQPGEKLVSVYTPKDHPDPGLQRDLDWLSGVIDGEGTVAHGLLAISQKKAVNPEVFHAIGSSLDRLKISYEIGTTHTSERFCLHGGRGLFIWLLAYAKLAKRKRFYEVLFKTNQLSETHGRAGGWSAPVVISRTPVGEEIVYDIETGTHNFVCDGFAVHNCQQQNDPQGGSVARFSERDYNAALVRGDRIPRRGETFLCWRPRYGGNPKTMRYSEGVAAKICDEKVIVLNAWQGTYSPSAEAERIVAAMKEYEAQALMMIDVPGADALAVHVRNEGIRRNRGIRIEWIDWREDEGSRIAAIEQIEPVLKVGRLLFSTEMHRAEECRKQFVYFGLTDYDGIIDCIARFTDRIPLSVMRANMEEEELEYQRRARESALLNQFLEQQGLSVIDEQVEQKTEAHIAAVSAATHSWMPPLPGGLDG